MAVGRCQSVVSGAAEMFQFNLLEPGFDGKDVASSLAISNENAAPPKGRGANHSLREAQLSEAQKSWMRVQASFRFSSDVA